MSSSPHSTSSGHEMRGMRLHGLGPGGPGWLRGMAVGGTTSGCDVMARAFRGGTRAPQRRHACVHAVSLACNNRHKDIAGPGIARWLVHELHELIRHCLLVAAQAHHEHTAHLSARATVLHGAQWHAARERAAAGQGRQPPAAAEPWCATVQPHTHDARVHVGQHGLDVLFCGQLAARRRGTREAAPHSERPAPRCRHARWQVCRQGQAQAQACKCPWSTPRGVQGGRAAPAPAGTHS